MLSAVVGNADNSATTIALLDCGSTSNIISEDLATDLGLHLTPLDQALTVQLAVTASEDEHKRIVAHKTSAFLELDDHVSAVDFLVLPQVIAPVIIGMPWLQEHDPRISWKTGMLHVGDHDIKAHPGPDADTLPLLSSAYVCSIAHSLDPGTTEIPECYAAYADVFSGVEIDALSWADLERLRAVTDSADDTRHYCQLDLIGPMPKRTSHLYK